MMKRSTRAQRILLCSLCLAPRSLAFVPQNPARFVAVPQSISLQSRSILPGPHTPVRASPCPPLKVSYDDLMEKLPSNAVIDAVDAAKDGKVVASDVAASAGVSLSQARKDLTALATLSRGDIAVSRDGELIYSFPNNLKGVLASNSAKFKALQQIRKVGPVAFYVLRVGFGVTLLASLVAIFSTIFFLSQSGSSSDDDRRRDNRGGGFGGGGMRMGGMWGPSPLDFFFYRPYGYYGVPAASRTDPEEMGFLESVFSYIFGDGNPNTDLEEKRLSLVASMIRENKGAVTAEQLAPFCDDAPEPSTMEASTYVDESFVLPIVAQLNGEPQVTEDGEIVYIFPELLMSASAVKVIPAASRDGMLLRRAGLSSSSSTGEIKQFLTYNRVDTRGALDKRDLMGLLESRLPPMTALQEAELLDSDPSVLQEQEYQFSLAPQMNRVLAAGLGAVNLGGALYLGNMLGQYAAYGIRLPAYFGVVQSLYPFLLTYAIAFNVIPVVRNLWIQKKNADIKQRNKTRRTWRTALASAAESSSTGKKLKAAAKMGTKVTMIGDSNDIIFDTSKPIEDMEQKKQQLAMEEFDRLLENDDNVFM